MSFLFRFILTGDGRSWVGWCSRSPSPVSPHIRREPSPAPDSLHGKKKKNQVKKRSLLEANAPPTSSAAAALGKAAGIGVDTSFEEQSRREKRARRFEQDELQRQAEEQQALRATFVAPLGTGGPGPGAGAGLAGRLGMPGAGAGFANGGVGGSRLDPGYQQSPSGLGRIGGGSGVPPVPPLGGMGGGGWAAGGGTRFPIAGFGDADLVADANVIDWDKDTVVGTSTKLEKPYLRLTSAPDPRTVRPLAVLQQTLELLKQKWRAEQNYAYICDQFKSMRQDLTVSRLSQGSGWFVLPIPFGRLLTRPLLLPGGSDAQVQRIKNAFTVKVYEIHARIALEKGDLGEYNQCQSQLRMLYAYDLPGCVMEFLAYRILYLLHTRNRREVNSLMTELHEAHRQDEAVRHALEVRKALVNGNYHRFFLLYADAPNMNAYIMDHFIERERVRALLIMAKWCVSRPSFIETGHESWMLTRPRPRARLRQATDRTARCP